MSALWDCFRVRYFDRITGLKYLRIIDGAERYLGDLTIDKFVAMVNKDIVSGTGCFQADQRSSFTRDTLDIFAYYKDGSSNNKGAHGFLVREDSLEIAVLKHLEGRINSDKWQKLGVNFRLPRYLGQVPLRIFDTLNSFRNPKIQNYSLYSREQMRRGGGLFNTTALDANHAEDVMRAIAETHVMLGEEGFPEIITGYKERGYCEVTEFQEYLDALKNKMETGASFGLQNNQSVLSVLPAIIDGFSGVHEVIVSDRNSGNLSTNNGVLFIDWNWMKKTTAHYDIASAMVYGDAVALDSTNSTLPSAQEAVYAYVTRYNELVQQDRIEDKHQFWFSYLHYVVYKALDIYHDPKYEKDPARQPTLLQAVDALDILWQTYQMRSNSDKLTDLVRELMTARADICVELMQNATGTVYERDVFMIDASGNNRYELGNAVFRSIESDTQVSVGPLYPNRDDLGRLSPKRPDSLYVLPWNLDNLSPALTPSVWVNPDSIYEYAVSVN